MSMNNRPNHNDDTSVLFRWYHHASQLPGSVDSFLALLRTQDNITEEQQQEYFGVSAEEFLRLKAMRMPRHQFFVQDAHRIATYCKLQHPSRFVSSMLLARNLMNAYPAAGSDQYYEAAFDEREDLDDWPEE
jgi:hypothetical protein